MMQHPPANSVGPVLRSPSALLSSCATALALVAATGGSARAQVAAFQGTPTVVAGSATINSNGGTAAIPRTNVVLRTPTAVIDWTPSDTSAGTTPIDFLPANGVATFARFGDFTVLNRILPATSRSVGLNGTVGGVVLGDGTQTIGGNIWFYSPTGIVAGGTSRFVAGGLIFSADDIPYSTDPSTGVPSFTTNGAIQFRNASGSETSAVEIRPGSVISGVSPDGNAYVALVAPRVQQDGLIQLDGSVGLVAAEQADITINQGLFDIRMLAGTTVANAISHSGETGRAITSGTLVGPQKVYIASLPKNTAITMLLGGTFGTAAANATQADRAIILSGGYDILDNSSGSLASVPGNTGDPAKIQPANIQIVTGATSPTVFNAALQAHATGTITANPERGQSITFGENAFLTGDTGVAFTADLDESLIANQGLFLTSPVSAGIALHTTNPTAGSGTNPATLSVANNLQISATNSGNGGVGTATGGTAYLQLDSGAVGPMATVGGVTTIEADGNGGITDTTGGSGFGGTAQLLMNGGTLTLHDTTIHANGLGAFGSISGAGGDAAGGTAEFVGNGGKSTLGGLNINADAEGGTGSNGGANGNVDSSGAIARVVSSGAGTELHVDSLSLSASALGDVVGGTSGTSQAGTVDIQVENGGLLTSAVQIQGFARAGWQLFGDSGTHDSAGITKGGTVTAMVAGGTLNAPGALFSTDAQALSALGAQGDAIGGNITVNVTDQAAKEGVATLTGDLLMSANGIGGDGSSGGNGKGGAAALHVDGGTLDVGKNKIQIDAKGQAGLAPSASATGGDVVVTTSAGGTQAGLAFGTLAIDVSGNAEVTQIDVGPLSAGNGGLGQGGTVAITASGASLAGSLITANLEGIGGDAALVSSGPLFTAGNGQGGTFDLTANGGAVNVDTVNVDAKGFGGIALGADTTDFGGIPGNGIGGSATITGASGSFTNQTFSLNASGVGGAASEGGSFGSPFGGSGQGGTTALVIGGANFTTTGGSLVANGNGADGANTDGTPGGSGIGGTATVTATNAVNYSLGNISLTADGTAGKSTGSPVGADGTGTGGTAKFINQGAADAAAGSRTVGTLMLEANGNAGTVGGNPGTKSVAGFVQISDLATGTNGAFKATSVDANALGLTTPPAGKGALIESTTNPLLVDTHFNVTAAGTITVAVTGKGTITAPDAFGLLSTLGDIVITHAAQTTPLTPTITGGTLTFDAAQNFNAGTGTLLSSTSDMLIRARNGSLTADTLTAVNSINAHALGGVTLNNAKTTGPFIEESGGFLAGGQIYITAGVDTLTLTGAYQPVDIVVGGTVSASGQLTAQAGRDILDAPSVLEGEAVRLLAARDISGADLSIISRRDLDVFVGRNLRANTVDVAGKLNTIDAFSAVTAAGELDVPGTLDIDNLVLRGATPGVLKSGGALTIGKAQTIGGLDVTSTNGLLTVGSLGGFPSGASGFLTAHAPTIVLTNISVSGDITAIASATTLDATGLNAGGAVTLTAKTVLTPANVTAGGAVLLTSNTSSIDAKTIQGQSITATAGTTLSLTGSSATAGGVTTNSAGLLTLSNDTASGDITGTSTGGAISATGLTAGGAIGLNANTALSASNVMAGSAVSFNSMLSSITGSTIQGQSIVATAGTTLSLTDATATGGGITAKSAGLQTLTNGKASGNIAGTSTAGAIDAKGLNAGGSVTLAANMALSASDVTAGGPVSFTSTLSSIDGKTIEGQSIDATAGTTLSLTDSTTTGGDITAQSPGLLTLGNDKASGGISGTSSGDAVDATGLTAGGAVGLKAKTTLTANSVTAGVLVTLASSNGDVGGNTIKGTGVTVTAPGTIGLDGVTATAGDIGATAGGVLTASDLTATGAVNLTATASSVAGSAIKGQTIGATAGTTLSLTDATATGGDITAKSAGLLTLANDTASGGISGNSTAGGVTATGLTAGGPVSLMGNGAVSANGVTTTGAATLTSTTSSIAGKTVQGQSIGAVAGTTLSLTDSTATGGDIVAKSPGVLTLTNDKASGGITGTSAGDAVNATGLAAGGAVGLSARTTLTANSIAAGGLVTLASSSGDVGGNTIKGTSVTVTAPGAIGLDGVTATAGDIGATAGGALTASSFTAAGAVDLASTGSSIAGNAIQGKTIDAMAGTTLTLTGSTATGGDITAKSGGLLTLTDDKASGGINGTSTGDAVNASGLTASGDVTLSAKTTLSANTVTSGGQVMLTSTSDTITGKTIKGTSVATTTPGAVSLDSVTATAGDIGVTAGGMLTATNLTGAGAVNLSFSGSSITGKTILGKSIGATADGSLSLTDVTAAGGDLTAKSAGLLTLSNDKASAGISGTSTGDGVKATGLTAGGGIALNAKAALTASFVTGGGQVTLASTDGTIDGNTIKGPGVAATAPGTISLDTVTATAGDIGATAGGALTGTNFTATGAVDLTSTTSSITGKSLQGRSIDTNADTTLSLTGSTATGGDITAKSDGLLTLTSDSASGGITATSTGDAVNASGLTAGGGVVLDAKTGLTAAGVTAGGPVSLTSSNGNIDGKTITSTSFAATAPGTITLDTVTATAGDIGATAGGALSASNFTTTGTVTLTSTTASFTGDKIQGKSIDAAAGSTLSLVDSTAAGGDLTAKSGGLLTLTNDKASGGISGTSTAGAIDASGLTVGGGIALNAKTGLTANSVTAGGPVSLTSSNGAIGGKTIRGTTIVASAPGAVILDTVGATAGDIGVTAGGALTARNFMATGAVNLTSTASSVAGSAIDGKSIGATAGTRLSLTDSTATGGDITAQSAGLLTLGNDKASGGISGTSSGDALDVSGLSAGGIVALSAKTALTANGVTAGGPVTLASSGGTIDGTAIQGKGVAATTPGAISLGTIIAVAGDIGATGGGAVSLQNGQASDAISLTSTGSTVTIGSAQAGGDLAVRAAGAATVGTLATGATVKIGSGDIVIGPAARLGKAGTTTLIELTNSDDSRRSFFGGADNAAGYSLNTAEVSQLFADDITLIAPMTAQSSAANPDVVVGAMNLTSRANNAAGQLGAQGTFTIRTTGRVLVNGAVTMTGVGNGNTFAIGAGDLIELDNQRGLIDLQGPNTTLAGTIDLSANQIMAVSSAAQTALAGVSDPVVVNARLSLNDGPVNQQGVLRANALRFTVSDALYIQNTGAGAAFGQRRGFLAGLGSIAITTSGTPLIAINGEVDDAPELGLDTIPFVTINGRPAPGSSGFAVGSTINGCVFVNVVACRQPPSAVVPNRDIIIDPLDVPPESVIDQPPTISTAEIEDVGKFNYEPLIDEPVTGSGNDDLWTQDCDPTKQSPCSRPPIDSAPRGKSP